MIFGDEFCFPHDVFHSKVLIAIQFSLPLMIYFKNNTLSYVEVKYRRWKYGPISFSRLNCQVSNNRDTIIISMIFHVVKHGLFSINILIWSSFTTNNASESSVQNKIL